MNWNQVERELESENFMNKLEELIKKFTEDKQWNTEERNGTHRFDKKIAWIESMIKEYADYFKMSVDEVVEVMEKNRTYSWPNYYQEANFPSISKYGELVGVFKTFDEFNEYSTEHFTGFKCPACGNIGSHPQLCMHRIEKDGKCDWCATGLFSGPQRMVILENGFDAIPIFEPVKEG